MVPSGKHALAVDHDRRILINHFMVMIISFFREGNNGTVLTEIFMIVFVRGYVGSMGSIRRTQQRETTRT
jgi:hypothetical protein